MTDQSDTAPIIQFHARPTLAEAEVVLSQLRRATQPPPAAPVEALRLLFETACRDTGGSQAARSFLCWLAGLLPDPTGYQGHGALELRRLDRQHKEAALEVLAWWAGPTDSDQPLYELLAKLRT